MPVGKGTPITNPTGKIRPTEAKILTIIVAPKSLSKTLGCFGSAKFGQMRAFLKLQIICDNLKLGEMHDKQSKVQNLA